MPKTTKKSSKKTTPKPEVVITKAVKKETVVPESQPAMPAKVLPSV